MKKCTSLYLLLVVLLSSFISCNKNSKSDLLKDLNSACLVQDTIDSTILSRVDHRCLLGKKINYLRGDVLDSHYYNMLEDSADIYVINLWFTRCPPCIAEIPELNKIKVEYQDSNVRFISICKDNIKNESQFLVEHSFNWHHLENSHDSIKTWFPPTAFPTTYILNTKYEIVDVKVGGSIKADNSTYHNLKHTLDSLLPAR